MPFSLYRIPDGAGDCGPMFNLLRRKDDGSIEVLNQPEKPLVGWHIQVGSPYARTYVGQDYWTTTVITEILEESEGYMKFKTTNSIYEWAVI